jgi:hypothetical protein
MAAIYGGLTMGKKAPKMKLPKKGSKKHDLYKIIKKHYHKTRRLSVMDGRLRFDRDFALEVAEKLDATTTNVYKMLLELARDHKVVSCRPIGRRGEGKIVQLLD